MSLVTDTLLDVASFSEVLAHHASITRLELAVGNLSDNATLALHDALTSNTSLRSLVALGVPRGLACAIARALLVNQRVNQLTLSCDGGVETSPFARAVR